MFVTVLTAEAVNVPELPLIVNVPAFVNVPVIVTVFPFKSKVAVLPLASVAAASDLDVPLNVGLIVLLFVTLLSASDKVV